MGWLWYDETSHGAVDVEKLTKILTDGGYTMEAKRTEPTKPEGTEVARIETPPPLTVDEVKAQVQHIQQIMDAVMTKGEHYGIIPGTKKPTLLQPGAQKLNLTFRFDPEYTEEIRVGDAWGIPPGHREVIIKCVLRHIDTGKVLGSGMGSCSTLESKYRYRLGVPEFTTKPVPKDYWNLRNTNPAKAQELLGGKGFVTAKNEDGQWFVAKKSAERTENPDIADVYNTVLKIAAKRAHVAAVLAVTAASDIFTQDLEDMSPESVGVAPEKKAAAEKKDPKAAPTTTPKKMSAADQKSFAEEIIKGLAQTDKPKSLVTGVNADHITALSDKLRARVKSAYENRVLELEAAKAEPSGAHPAKSSDDGEDFDTLRKFALSLVQYGATLGIDMTEHFVRDGEAMGVDQIRELAEAEDYDAPLLNKQINTAIDASGINIQKFTVWMAANQE